MEPTTIFRHKTPNFLVAFVASSKGASWSYLMSTYVVSAPIHQLQVLGRISGKKNWKVLQIAIPFVSAICIYPLPRNDYICQKRVLPEGFTGHQVCPERGILRNGREKRYVSMAKKQFYGQNPISIAPHGGFLKQRYPQLSSMFIVFSSDFPEQKPCSYGGTPHSWEPSHSFC